MLSPEFLAIGGGSASGYLNNVANSLRFRANNSANATRTNATAGSAQNATFSFWVKRGQLGAGQAVFGTYNVGSNYFYFGFTSADRIVVLEVVTSIQYHLETSAVFRDPSAWYHIVVAIDTTQATAANRVRIYANGTELTSFSTNSPPALNYSHTYLGANARVNYIAGNSALGYLDAHLAKFHYVDGQQLTPASFGQADGTGLWMHKAFTGTYGTLGSLHEFEDATTTTTIVKDTSGNSNGYASSGISVTSGVTFDQMTDTPTNGYPTLSPINAQSVVTISEANTAASYGGVANTGTALVSVPFPTTGKWYYEHHCVATGASDFFAGILLNRSVAGNAGNIIVPGTNSNEYAYRANGQKMIAGVTSAYGASYGAGDVIGVAFDADNMTLEFFKNGASQGQITSLAAGQYVAFTQTYNGGSAKLNFGQRSFAYTPPTNFKALNTQNIANTTLSLSGSFTGNAAADGPFVWTDGNPATLTINGNAVTFGTHADKIAGGFKLRSSSASYNAAGSNTWSATAGLRFVRSKRGNNAQVNP